MPASLDVKLRVQVGVYFISGLAKGIFERLA
jgi:hypothetical protein